MSSTQPHPPESAPIERTEHERRAPHASRSPLPATTTATAIGDEEEEPQPFVFTRYSLYIILATFSFALSKAIYAYMGDSVIPTTLEFIFGGIFTIGMYWIGLYQSVRPKRFTYLLHDHISLRSAVEEAILVTVSAGYIYCYIRLIRQREPLRRYERPTTLVFYWWCSHAVSIYIISGWFGRCRLHLTPRDLSILWTVVGLYLFPVVKVLDFQLTTDWHEYSLLAKVLAAFLVSAVVAFPTSALMTVVSAMNDRFSRKILADFRGLLPRPSRVSNPGS